ncbi:hypothetical protein HNR46_000100 [Haloferula luteola]|uniref:Type II/III secretion system secretin-like domain-containing protein n=1 Tax=Haloferula luteola TaxID=595692 RepID=A0A840V7Y5_9BACT|nr:hypothetical protein [Haloferula luteola]MBB5349879.1 hypothetical protein [Haloferula luteola]
MRFFLILIGLGLAGWYGWRSVKSALSFESAKEVIQKVEDQTQPQKKPRKPIENGIASGIRQSLGTDKEQAPFYARTVRFENRPAPAVEMLSQLATVGVNAFADSVTRSIVLTGPGDRVEAIALALESGDWVPGSCGCQAFAVYVSRKAEKGFDLVAALSAVGGHKTTASIGGGDVVVTLGLDEVVAALQVIADGEAVDVIQRPHVRLLDGVPARVEAIEEVPVPSTVVSQGIAQTSIEFRKVGLQLTVEPVFLGGDRVRLSIRQENGLLGSPVEIEGNDIPVIQTQAVESGVELTVGQSVVLGGMRTYRKTLSRGLLRNVESVEEGALYVILSTFSDAPRATLPVPDASGPLEGPEWFEDDSSGPLPSPADWIDGELLPRKGWEEEERELIRSKLGHPAK